LHISSQISPNVLNPNHYEKSMGLSVWFVLALLCVCFGEAAPQRNRGGRGGGNGNGGGQQQTPQQKAAQKPGGISTAKDGSTILDQTVQIK